MLRKKALNYVEIFNVEEQFFMVSLESLVGPVFR